MGLHKIKKGLNLPIAGEPTQEIAGSKEVRQVALLGGDYIGMKPTMLVNVGDTVKLGQLLFTDKKMSRVKYTAPGSGKVAAIHRGAKRTFLAVVIELDGSSDEVTFNSYSQDQLSGLERSEVVENLLESGMWPTLRTRPFSKVANPDETPHSIFVNAMDSNPLAPNVAIALKGNEAHFKNGLTVLSKLTDGKLFVCKAPGDNIPGGDGAAVSVEEFQGPHPAGLVGTHIHFLDPVGRQKTVWHIDAQNVVAIGALFTSGKLFTDRIVSLAGPVVKNPRLLRTRVGASLYDLADGEIADGENRIISGSVFAGMTATEEVGFLGRFHQQVSILSEGREKEFLGWLDPGLNRFSIKRLVLSKLTPGKKFAFNTAVNGGHRAIVPIGSYERVMPLDILPTFLLRSIAVNDVEEAEKLGVLELDEEDISLCTFVCPSKTEFGPMLRETLTTIEKEG